MADHQLEPFENVELGEKQDQLQVFEKAVLEHEGRGTDEDSGSAPLPANYPYKQRMRRSVYEKEKQKLQIELLKVQSWVKDSGQRIVSLFEGRDAAGKGGTIKRFMEHLNPRGARVVLWRNQPLPNAANGISNATSKTCRPQAKWYSSTAHGTTVPA